MCKDGETTNKKSANGSNGSNNDNKEEPAKKKAKTDQKFDVVLNPAVQTPAHEQQLKDAYQASTPYHHGRIENVFAPDLLMACKEQIKQHSKVNFKETDLFRVYQSIDFANLTPGSELAQQMPAVMQLRQVLYSQEWRSMIERVTNLQPGTLSNQVDCACNCHAPGCHLLCHDDVIGTRKVSYIIYLTEPDWTLEEGGALELYDSVPEEDNNNNAGRREPETCPSKTVLPLFNSMAFFVVEPGVSFHAVQEVLGERPRLSVQGWYHAAKAPEQIQHATLNRLKEMNTDDNTSAPNNDSTDGFTPFMPPQEEAKQSSNDDETPTILSKADRTYLTKYLNDTYLNPTAMDDIRKRFEEDSSVQLRQFFRSQWSDAIKEATKDKDQAKPKVDDDGYYQWGVSEEWKLIGPPHKQRYLQYDEKEMSSQNDDKPSSSAGQLLAQLQQNVLQSPQFARYLHCVTSLGNPLGYKGQIRRFRPGLDYTVAHYGILTHKAVLDATMCFAAGTGGVLQKDSDDKQKKKSSTDEKDDDNEDDIDEADMLWQSDEMGGFECYIEADDYDGESKEKEEGMPEAADEYNAEDDTNLLSVSASNNTLSLVYRDPGTMRFIKYVGSRAPSSRWDISMEYQVPEDGDDVNDDEGMAEKEE
ncbi:Prolyl 3,4-dihydroxylase OGFOD1 [Seminavis robusta]|uniref:Prolyl 3,4-dihydroxylase OGFOD1 n=1 Tax=Seminavis robusta TaxID=568900 RepID=A0A9N8HM49_9STRA|nr:Prolyl 3,4-dihydroxylase OGFOD1 [Seminavis robusta]|eukprot:Sro968_g226040.1 Prolyl 3,4-dihydroxylase OGFOD1 (643) ;mRNA; f:25304-27232